MSFRHLALIAGYLSLAALTVVVYGGGFLVSLDHHPVVMTVMGLWLAGLAVEGVREWRSVFGNDDADVPGFDARKDTLAALALLLGALVTFWASVDLGLGPVVASALTGIAAAAFAKPYAVPAFCGSFVGMSSAEVYGYSGVALAAAAAGVVFVLGKHAFNGVGGKLGTIAWAGCVAAALLMGEPLLTGRVPGWDVGAPLIIYCAAGAWLTFILSVRFALGPVMASGLVGLAGGLLLPVLHGAQTGTTLAVGVFCASFAGMSAVKRFGNASWMLPAGVVSALAFMLSAPFMGGVGGKLGTIAFGAVIGLRGLISLMAGLRRIGKS